MWRRHRFGPFTWDRPERYAIGLTSDRLAGVLSIALADAVRLRLLPHNVAGDARLPRRVRPEMQAWTEADATRFLESVVDDRMYPLWRLVLATGMRRGELCGLRWQDVDLAAGVLTVASTRVVAERVVVGTPKTVAGARLVSLDSDTVRVLQGWRKRQLEERDPGVQRQRLQELIAIANDPVRARSHLLETSMISGLRQSAQVS